MFSLLRVVRACVLASALGLPLAAQPVSLANRGLSVSLDSESGKLLSMTNRLTGETHRVKALSFRLDTNAGVLAAKEVAGARSIPGGIEFRSARGAIVERARRQR